MIKLIAQFFRKKENKFDHIISLGYNCEVTFRFLKYFRAEESSLFNWAYSSSILDLIKALNNFDSIGSADFYPPNPLWECRNTHIRFHGKVDMRLYINKLATQDIIDEDKKDLTERIIYLKNKFLKILRDDSYKLYIYKIRDNEFINENIEALQKSLNLLGANNYKLLIVCQNNIMDTDVVSNAVNDVIIRSVKYFAPDGDVTNKKYKKNGWNKVFDEFYCDTSKIKIRKKKYKFQMKKTDENK